MRRWGKSGARQRLLRAGKSLTVLGSMVTLGVAAPSGATTSPTPITKASTSARGVTSSAINVVFPIISFTSIEGEFEIKSDAEYGEQTKAIKLFVNQINDAGGIHGRKINPMIVSFDPTNVDEERALCKQWTEGNPPVFAVVDGLGTYEGTNELCITQEGQTPMLSQWTTTTNWTDLGSPYLWWTGADDAPILAATVRWGLSSGRLGHGKKVGVVVSDLASDQGAFDSYLLPDLRKVGVVPQVVTVTADVGESASTSSTATLAVERLKAAHALLVVTATSAVLGLIEIAPSDQLEFALKVSENGRLGLPGRLLPEPVTSVPPPPLAKFHCGVCQGGMVAVWAPPMASVSRTIPFTTLGTSSWEFAPLAPFAETKVPRGTRVSVSTPSSSAARRSVVPVSRAVIVINVSRSTSLRPK